MAKFDIFTKPFSWLYPFYLEKAEKKGKTKAELDRILCWVTGYSQAEFDTLITSDTDLRTFIEQAPLNPDRELITGVVCGVRVEEVEDPLMRELRYMDKVVDELARGKKIESILRTP
ncbi:DUF2200 domain-containing protein [Qipengyuania nanhaisediminis]|uniref:DUF2200 domain-containing protein n=1 Tax=Qipengyuania nanhaisediminis TaxID=604088 RepID=UPI0038B385E8